MLKQMEDETEEEAVPLGREQYTDNSPSGKAHQREMRAPAAVWTTVKRFKDVTLMGKRFNDDDRRALYEFSHVCVLCWNIYICVYIYIFLLKHFKNKKISNIK